MYREIYVDEGYACAAWRNVIINLCGEAITLDTLAVGRKLGDELEKDYGPNIGVLTVISADMRMPDDEVRAQAAKDMEASQHRLKASATLIRGTGFRASAFRTAYATLNLFSRNAAPSKVASTLEEAARFLVDTLGHESALAQELMAAVEKVERRLAGNEA